MQWRLVLTGAALCSAGKVHPIYSVLNDPEALQRVPEVIQRMFQGVYWEEPRPVLPIKSVNLVLSMRELENPVTYLLDFGPTSKGNGRATKKQNDDGPLFSGCSPKTKVSKGRRAKEVPSPSGPKDRSGE